MARPEVMNPTEGPMEAREGLATCCSFMAGGMEKRGGSVARPEVMSPMEGPREEVMIPTEGHGGGGGGRDLLVEELRDAGVDPYTLRPTPNLTKSETNPLEP